MHFIDLGDYDVDYTELVRWSLEKGVDLYAVNAQGGNCTSKTYAFSKEEDYLAFILTFQKEKDV